MVCSTNLVTTIIGFGLSATFIVFLHKNNLLKTTRVCGIICTRTIYEIETRIDIERVIFSALICPSSCVLIFLINMTMGDEMNQNVTIIALRSCGF